MAEVEAEQAARRCAEIELAKVQKELRRAHQQVDAERAKHADGHGETEHALAESWAELQRERGLRQQAEERLEAVGQWIVAQGLHMGNNDMDEKQMTSPGDDGGDRHLGDNRADEHSCSSEDA